MATNGSGPIRIKICPLGCSEMAGVWGLGSGAWGLGSEQKASTGGLGSEMGSGV